MILGMTTFTTVHVLLSLIGIVSGFVVLLGLLSANPMNRYSGLEPACRRLPHGQVQPRQPCSCRHTIRGGSPSRCDAVAGHIRGQLWN
jgi:hypothetical protein